MTYKLYKTETEYFEHPRYKYIASKRYLAKSLKYYK